MTEVKKKIIAAINNMDDIFAEKLWKIVEFELNTKDVWNNIKEEPTDEERETLKAYRNGDERYQPCISHEELFAKSN